MLILSGAEKRLVREYAIMLSMKGKICTTNDIDNALHDKASTISARIVVLASRICVNLIG
jgi:hypothetical protein